MITNSTRETFWQALPAEERAVMQTLQALTEREINSIAPAERKEMRAIKEDLITVFFQYLWTEFQEKHSVSFLDFLKRYEEAPLPSSVRNAMRRAGYAEKPHADILSRVANRREQEVSRVTFADQHERPLHKLHALGLSDSEVAAAIGEVPLPEHVRDTDNAKRATQRVKKRRQAERPPNGPPIEVNGSLSVADRATEVVKGAAWKLWCEAIQRDAGGVIASCMGDRRYMVDASRNRHRIAQNQDIARPEGQVAISVEMLKAMLPQDLYERIKAETGVVWINPKLF
jgi:hypothetical protein